MRAGILTISDRVSKGEMEDTAGSVIAQLLQAHSQNISIARRTVPDEREEISAVLTLWSRDEGFDAVVTTGGTGLGPRDVTPEATLDVIDARIPGIEEAIRAKGLQNLPAAMLSRGIAGFCGQTLIVNLPGSPGGAREGTEVVLSVLDHAVDLLHGRTRHHHHAAAAD